jgi:hypothetical protein
MAANWTEAELAWATALRAQNVPDDEIARQIGTGRTGYAVTKKFKRVNGHRGKPRTLPRKKDRDVPPPDEVVAEAVRAYAAPCTLGMLVFGDPRPGRSFLERRA